MYRLSLHQIVRLREALQKWRKLTHSKPAGGSLSGSGGSRRTPVTSLARVPPGHLAVYVGAERERFVIKTSRLAHPLFKALLKKTEEEVGFHHQGGLTIPCDVSSFERLLRLMQGKHAVSNMSTRVLLHGHEHRLDAPEDVDEYHLRGFQRLLQELLHLHVKEISSHLPTRCLPELGFSNPSMHMADFRHPTLEAQRKISFNPL